MGIEVVGDGVVGDGVVIEVVDSGSGVVIVVADGVVGGVVYGVVDVVVIVVIGIVGGVCGFGMGCDCCCGCCSCFASGVAGVGGCRQSVHLSIGDRIGEHLVSRCTVCLCRMRRGTGGGCFCGRGCGGGVKKSPLSLSLDTLVVAICNCGSLVGGGTQSWGCFLGGGGCLGAGCVGLTAGVVFVACVCALLCFLKRWRCLSCIFCLSNC